MTDIDVPPSPGVGARRKGPKDLPRLPRSAFSPPNSGASEKFLLPPSPSTLHPTTVIDGHVSFVDGKLSGWSESVGRVASRNVAGVVLALPPDANQSAIDQIRQDYPSLNILSVIVPVSLDKGPPPQLPTFAGDIKVSLSIQFVKNSIRLVEALKWVLARGYTVDIDVRAPVRKNEEGWGDLEELLSEVLKVDDDDESTAHAPPRGSIILSNILPPPHDLNISIVKMLNHPAYRAYQSDTASLSLFPSVFVKYVPPIWGTATAQTLGEGADIDAKDRKEWKRRIRMFLGPAIEAFGYQRVIYGSSNGAKPGNNSSEWYEIARESLAEIGIEEDAVDAVFGGNASGVYGS